MRIDRIDLYHVAMPLITPWRTAYGEDHVVESILVRMESKGCVGWGETTPLGAPAYSPEFAAGVFSVLKTWLAPRVIGSDVQHAAELGEMFDWIAGNPFAKAGLDLAWWDLHARLQHKSLHEMLGGEQRAVPVGAGIGVCDSIEELLRHVRAAVAAGYPRVKLKFKPGWDLPVVRSVRAEFPDLVMHIDCNAAYGISDIAMFEQLDEFGLAMIEQPLATDDLIDHAALQSRLRTPVCLDESITSLHRARKAIDIRACRYMNLKPGRVGGLTNALAIHGLCRGAGIPCWVGGMLESAIGARHCLALATLPNFTYPADIATTGRFYQVDLGAPAIDLNSQGEAQPADLPGIGAVPHAGRLAACTVNHEAFAS